MVTTNTSAGSAPVGGRNEIRPAKKKTHSFSNLFLLYLLLFTLVLTACQVRQKGRKASEDWSRSVPQGTFIRGDIDMVVELTGNQVHLVWLKQGENDVQFVEYVQLDDTAVTQIRHDLPLLEDQVRNPKLALSGTDNLHFLWSSRADGEREWDLRYGQLNPQSGDIAETQMIAPKSDVVGKYTLTPDGAGGIFVVWENSVDQGLYGVQIGSDGMLIQATTLLAQGRTPSLQVDETGNLYMTWMESNNVYFASLAEGILETAVGEIVVTIPQGTGQTLDGPELGVAGEWAYLFWSTFNSSGLQAGTAIAEYIAFPLDSPRRQNGQTILMFPEETQPYEPYDGAYSLTHLAPPATSGSGTDFVRQPNTASALGNELAVAYAVNQDLRLDRVTQIGTAIFKDGEFTGYQFAGKTDAFSQEPVLANDAAGNLHIAWREGGRGRLAYYAVTTPEGRANLDRLDGSDVSNFVMDGGIEVIAGMLFFPLACIWLFPGLAIIGTYHWWRGESDMKDKSTIIVLVVAILASQLMKIVFLPTITTYVPFSAWLDVPTAVEGVLILIVPLLIIGIGLFVAWRLHSRTPSGLAFFFWFTATDALLTLAIYGVNLLGVF